MELCIFNFKALEVMEKYFFEKSWNFLKLKGHVSILTCVFPLLTDRP